MPDFLGALDKTNLNLQISFISCTQQIRFYTLSPDDKSTAGFRNNVSFLINRQENVQKYVSV
jgi:hypothetical protein